MRTIARHGYEEADHRAALVVDAAEAPEADQRDSRRKEDHGNARPRGCRQLSEGQAGQGTKA